jgi:hypothetical protein
MTIAYVEATYRLQTEMTNTEVSVLAALAAMASEDGCCWYRQSVLATRLRLHPQTVKITLRDLARKGLIVKDVKLGDDGAVVATQIRLNFEPVALGPATTDNGTKARWGGVRRTGGGGAVDTGGGGVEDTGLNGSEQNKTPPTPKGDVEAVWEITPTKSRQRSTSKAQVERSLGAAYKRGHTLEQILGGLKGYFASREATRENGQYIKGVHRMIENDRWLEFSAKAPVHHMAPASPWPRRLHEWVTRSEWDDAGWGPRPGQPGCKAPADEAAQALAERAAAREARLAKQAGASS